MQIRAGSLLIAHPVYAHPEHKERVVYITESNSNATSGIILNNLSNYDLRVLMSQHNIDWYGDSELYIGGTHQPNSLVMLHTDEWYSSSTMQIDGHLSVSSDDLMLEKLEIDNTPDWYRLFVGHEAWDAQDLEHQMRSVNPKWLLLSHPSQALIELADEHLWQSAVEEYSQDVFSNYI